MLSSATRELWWCLRCFLYIAGGSCWVQLQETFGGVWGASYTLQAGHVEFSYKRLMAMFEVLLIHCRRVMWSSATRDLWWCLRCFLYIAGGSCGVQLRENYGDVWDASYTLQAGHVDFSYERLMVMFEVLLIHCRRVMLSSATRDLWWCLRRCSRLKSPPSGRTIRSRSLSGSTRSGDISMSSTSAGRATTFRTCPNWRRRRRRRTRIYSYVFLMIVVSTVCEGVFRYWYFRSRYYSVMCKQFGVLNVRTSNMYSIKLVNYSSMNWLMTPTPTPTPTPNACLHVTCARWCLVGISHELSVSTYRLLCACKCVFMYVVY